MPARSWKFHFGRFVLAALLGLLLGWISGRWVLVAGILLVGYLGWLLYNTYRLHDWLRTASTTPPESKGLWSDVFNQIHQLQVRNLEQQDKHRAVIEEFRDMTDAFPDATLVLDGNDNLTWFNRAARKLLGLKDGEDLGQPVTNLIRGPDFANWLAVQDKVSSNLPMTSPQDSNIILSVSAVRFGDDQRLIILRNVTDIQNLERVRRDFVANVSHELRTPLTVLVGYLEGMNDQCPEDLVPAVERMQEQARQMQALLNDLLELSRLQSAPSEGNDKRVNVPAIIAQLKEQAEEISQGNHQLKFEVDEKLHLMGSAQDIESAFRNLIGNAVHYTPDEGTITVRWFNSDRGPVFAVEDTGIGIPHRDIPRLTERFYRVGSDRSRHSGGTGLGLAIVKHVLNAHDARLEITSELGEGSTFVCRFPKERNPSSR